MEKKDVGLYRLVGWYTLHVVKETTGLMGK